MSDITLSVVILIVIIIFYATQWIPLSVTSVLGSLMMAFFGIISFADSISPFGGDTVLLVVGVIIMGNALNESGVTVLIGEGITRVKGVGNNEKLFLAIVMLLASMLSAFLSNVATVAMFLPLIAATAIASGGVITKKNTYMAVGIAALVGGNCTLVGSTPQLIAQGVLEQTEGCTPMGFFELTKGGVLIVAIVIIYFVTIGYRLQKRVFTFEEVKNTEAQTKEKKVFPRNKAVISCCIFIASIICFMTGVGTMGTVALTAGGLCIATGCISEKKAFLTMDWTAVAILGGALGFSKGLNQSGAIAMIAEKTLTLFGGTNASPYVLCVALFILSALLGNIMSHTATSAILTPLGVAMALALEANPTTFAIAIVIGCNTAFSTPVATTPVTMTLCGGYRFMDYVKVGGLLNLVAVLIGAFMIPLLYGL